MKPRKLVLTIAVILALLCQATAAYAVSYDGAATISSSVTESGTTYSSTSAGQNALLVTGGTSTLTNPTVSKSGSPSGGSDDYDFYGTNAAVLVTGGTLNISGGTVTTSGAYANAVFAYGSGVINISDTAITTSDHNSGGIMVTGGGTLNATDLTVSTAGGSSAAIRSDRGGGTITVNGGSYTTSGSGSPAIYSTADITVTDAELTSNGAEGVVIEGGNSVTLNGVTLTDTNTTLNGQSTTYKNVFLYQSMSGDASNGGGSFSATNCTIVTNKGDSFFVTNNAASITLSGNTIVNNDPTGCFLRAQAGAWGSSGSNGGNVTLTLDGQTVSGDICIDDISTLTMVLKNGSSYTGTINGANTAKSIVIILSADSSITLTGDSYVYSIDNADESGSNLITGSYTLTTEAGEAGGASSANSGSGGGSKPSGDGQTPPEKPDGENGKPGDGQTPPEKPDGENGKPGDSQTPPEKPDGENGKPGDGQTPPEKPDGENGMPGDGQTPPEKPAEADAPSVQLSSQSVTVDGAAVAPQIYNVGGCNYFKLRDLAMLLKDSGAPFSVSYDEDTRTIQITTGEGYTPVDGELTAGEDLSASCVKSTQSLVIDGQAVSLEAYNIGGNNYFKLRDLGDALGFGVDYDEDGRTVLITTG